MKQINFINLFMIIAFIAPACGGREDPLPSQRLTGVLTDVGAIQVTREDFEYFKEFNKVELSDYFFNANGFYVRTKDIRNEESLKNMQLEARPFLTADEGKDERLSIVVGKEAKGETYSISSTILENSDPQFHAIFTFDEDTSKKEDAKRRGTARRVYEIKVNKPVAFEEKESSQKEEDVVGILKTELFEADYTENGVAIRTNVVIGPNMDGINRYLKMSSEEKEKLKDKFQETNKHYLEQLQSYSENKEKTIELLMEWANHKNIQPMFDAVTVDGFVQINDKSFQFAPLYKIMLLTILFTVANDPS